MYIYLASCHLLAIFIKFLLQVKVLFILIVQPQVYYRIVILLSNIALYYYYGEWHNVEINQIINKENNNTTLFLDFIQIQKTLLNNILIGKKTSE